MSAPLLAPWLQSQLGSLLSQRGNAWLLSGPSGLGQFDLALALARAWLCERPGAAGACGICSSCHALEVHTHADLCMLLPETLSIALGWPLDEKTQDDLDNKKRKPSKEIKVDAARDAVAFTQFTRSRGTTKVVLVFPAERMNSITANTLLKTLEEPPGAVKFVLATEAADQLLPTIRSRCLTHTMRWPDFQESLAWLKTMVGHDSAAPEDLHTVLAAAGGRPADALAWMQGQPLRELAKHWRALPAAMARGDAKALADWTPTQAVDALQKLCHDLLATRVGAQPRFFDRVDLPPAASQASVAGLHAMTIWSKELAGSARTSEHPFNAGLMLEALASRAELALGAK